MIKVVCVWTGKKYHFRYVLHLKRMVQKYLPAPHEFICLTDQPPIPDHGINFIDISSYKLHSWFAKMLVFNRELTGEGKILYIDLDMAITKDLDHLISLEINHLGICENFTRIYQSRDGGKPTWPCGFGSCVMLLPDGYGHEVWGKFSEDSWKHIAEAKQFGDQHIIEKLTAGKAVFLQDVMPDGYFLHYRDFTDEFDPSAGILVFAGNTKPADCEIKWIRDAWYCSH